jgi:hypothetical protein
MQLKSVKNHALLPERVFEFLNFFPVFSLTKHVRTKKNTFLIKKRDAGSGVTYLDMTTLGYIL